MTSNAELMGQTLDDIADAIRLKRNLNRTIPMLDFADEIRRIQTGSDPSIEIDIAYYPVISYQIDTSVQSAQNVTIEASLGA